MAKRSARSPSPAAEAARDKHRPADADDRWRFVLIGLASLLLSCAGVGRYPLAVFPYIYLGLLQHALRGGSGWRLWLWLGSATYVAMLYGVLEFLPVADAGYFIVTLFLSVFPALPCAVESLLASQLLVQNQRGEAVMPLESTLLLPIISTACDYLWANCVLYGSYGLWPYSQYGVLPVMQLASVFGIYGLSFFIAWSASLMAWLLGSGQQSAAAQRKGMGVLCTLWGTVWLLGGARLSLLMPHPDARTVRVHALSSPLNTVVRNDLIRMHLGPTIARQPLYGGFSPDWAGEGSAAEAPTELWEHAASDRAWAVEAIGRAAAAGEAELIMLPELGLTCKDTAEEAELVEAVQAIADEHGVVVALGLGVNNLTATVPLHPVLGALLELAPEAGGDGGYLLHGVEENKIRVLQPTVSAAEAGAAAAAEAGDSPSSYTYWKRNMVPLIEAPFTNVAEVYGFKGNATPATHPSRKSGRLGTAICFDMEHPAFIRQLHRADIIINPSYDCKCGTHSALISPLAPVSCLCTAHAMALTKRHHVLPANQGRD